jgi:hypothetical protein
MKHVPRRSAAVVEAGEVDTAVGAAAEAAGVAATAAEAGAAEIAATAAIAGKRTRFEFEGTAPQPRGTLSFPSENLSGYVCANLAFLPDLLQPL